MYQLWILPLLFSHSYQISDPNCLRGNLGAVDAEFRLLNKYEKIGEVTSEDVFEHASLLSTRFKRTHRFSAFQTAGMKILEDGMSLFLSNSRNVLELFLTASILERTDDLDRAVHEYKNQYDRVQKFNSVNEGIVKGLYLTRLMTTFTAEVKAVVAAFGPKENSTFAVGDYYRNCTKIFNNEWALPYLQRMHFITCELPAVRKQSTEESADYVIQTCDEVRENARAINVTAEIRCLVSYPSYGISTEGVVGSYANFQKFWCRIIHEVVRDKGHTQIIMDSAFDNTPIDYKSKNTDLSAGKFYRGWWRRRVTTFYGTTAFVEKVEELEGSGGHRNCTEECSLCDSNEQCCEKRTCIADSSFQPFEIGKQAKVCQSRRTTCAPRFPVTSARSHNPIDDTGTNPTGLLSPKPQNVHTSFNSGQRDVEYFNMVFTLTFSICAICTFCKYVSF